MEFIEEIKILENTYHNSNEFISSVGTSPFIITNIPNINSNELDEQYIRAIARYVAANTNSTYLLKTKDSIIYNKEEFNEKLSSLLKESQLLINIANTYEDCDVTYGIYSNQERDYSTVKELEDAFKEAGITNVVYNEQYKVETVFANTDIDVIQIEINGKCRDIDNPEKLKQVCNALINFIKMYSNYSD